MTRGKDLDGECRDGDGDEQREGVLAEHRAPQERTPRCGAGKRDDAWHEGNEAPDGEKSEREGFGSEGLKVRVVEAETPVNRQRCHHE